MSIELDDRRFLMLMILAIASVFTLLLWTALAYKCDAPLIGSQSSNWRSGGNRVPLVQQSYEGNCDVAIFNIVEKSQDIVDYYDYYDSNIGFLSSSAIKLPSGFEHRSERSLSDVSPARNSDDEATYGGLATFWSDDIMANLCHNISQLVAKRSFELAGQLLSPNTPDVLMFRVFVIRSISFAVSCLRKFVEWGYEQKA